MRTGIRQEHGKPSNPN